MIPRLSDVVNYLEGNTKYYVGNEHHEEEQVLLRMYLCKECFHNARCLYCGCKTPQMFYAPSKKDSKGRFAEFLSKDQWEALKTNIEDYAEFFRLLSTGEIHGHLFETGSVDGLTDRASSSDEVQSTGHDLQSDQKSEKAAP